MIRSRLRSTIHQFLDWLDDGDGEEPQEEPEESEPVHTTAFVMTPNGPQPIPEGLARALHALMGQGAGAVPLDRTPTMRNGPNGSFYSIKEVDCSPHAPIDEDPELQGLLLAGWNPVSVLRTPQGAVRVYLKRQLHS